jgi:hypothetical protein
VGRRAPRSSRAACGLIGHRFSRETHDLRDFLARNRIPGRWLDVERDSESRELLTVAGVDESGLAGGALEDGTVLERPTILELAERLGVAVAPAAITTTSSSSAAGRRDWRRPSTAPRRACAR